MPRTALIFAWLALLWERSARILWPGLAWLSLFGSLSLFGAWERFGDPARAVFGLATLAAAVWLTRKGSRGFAWPTGEEAARRVEEDSHISARPHEAMRDEPAEHDETARSVWREHQKRMQARLAGAHARRPKGAWAEMDGLALRGVAVIALVAAWSFAGPAARDRLSEAFGLAPIIAGGADATLDAWIDPPAYTGRAPVFLAEDDESARAPEGAVFVARVAGARRAPRLVARGEGETIRAEPRRIGDGVWEARIPLASTSDVSLQSGGARRHWRVDIQPDLPPTARILAVPEGSANGELELIFSAEDDYGVVAQALEFRREDAPSDPWERIEILSASAAELDGEAGRRALIETAQHRLAGERVEIRIAAQDAAGNEGRSPTLGVTLPERVFLDALARAVAEQRRAVLEHRGEYAPLNEPPVLTAETMPPGPPIMSDQPARRIERAPDGMQRVALALGAITDAPEFFFDDGVVYLGLRSVLHRLRRARHDDALGEIEDDLWQIALRAELGSLADAEAQLRAAERALMEALARGADETELNALFEAYQQAMENYLAALAREALEENRMAEGGGQGMQMDNQSIQDMLDALREAAELGDTANARQALQQLTEMLRNMQMNLAAGQGGEPQDDPISEAIRRALEELSDAIGEQRDLQDRTFNLDQQQGGQPGEQQPGAGQQGGQPQPGSQGESQADGSGAQTLAENQNGSGQAGQLADEQGALAQALGQALEQLREGGSADGTEGFGGAEEAMRNAEEALRGGDTEGALEAQGEALAGLRDGAEQLARELMERMQEQQSAQAGEGEGERDPLGRPAEGAMSDGSGVDVPDQMDRARAREILEELRRRAAEAGRSQEELDYIERLLDRF